ncbi:hypothetical protein M0R72_15660 [Candidatus Pacearchaeota archaeon]|jgi:hypothetical protein|nr:hypothetical protein [Candidatus Pacearchaeota archaeon]
MSGDDREIGMLIQKSDDLDKRLTNIEVKVDKILCLVNQWRGMIAVYSGLAAITISIVIKLIWK